MAEAIAISVSAKLVVAMSRSAALGISHLIGVRSDVAAAVQDLDLLRAFLRFTDSRRGRDAERVATWLRQARHVAFELEDIADECSYLSLSGSRGLAGRDCINVMAWIALSRRLHKARESLRRLSADKEQHGIRPSDGNDGTGAGAGPSDALVSRAHFLEDEAASVLNLSIDDLPHHLKKCFLSCSVYPEDLLIKRKLLIRRWIAQGLVVEEQLGLGQRKAEDVADGYLDQIVQRNLMWVAERNEFGRVKRCTIHDTFRELIINRARAEDGLLSLVKSEGTMDCSARIRHLVVDRCRNEDPMFFTQWDTLRTFTVFGSEFDVSIVLPRFRLLTVLNLWLNGTKKLPGSLTNLRNLRYLGIHSTLIAELPEELGNLQKLQTLDAKLSMVRRLPSSIAKLRSLRHLIVLTCETTDLLNPYPGMAVRVPTGLEKLTNLQTLKYVRAHKKMVRSLAGLDQMRSLELSGVNESLVADLSSSISRMSCLQRLGLETEPEADTVLDLESTSQPPKLLQKLSLTGRLQGAKLPSWTSSLTSLVRLRLCRCHIGHDSLVLLTALPRLVNLSLITTYQGSDMVFVECGYPSLRKLTLEDLPNLSHIEFQEGCLVNLRDLVLGQCTELTEIPRGMEKLKYLKNFELFGMPTEFVDKLKQQNGHTRYHNPPSSDFYQAHRFLRCFRFVEN